MDRWMHRQKYSFAQTNRQKARKEGRQKIREKELPGKRTQGMEMQIDKMGSKKHSFSQTDRQTDGQTDRQTDKDGQANVKC